MTDPAIRELAKQLADLKRQMTALSTSNRLSHSALEPTGRIVQYDEDGVPLAVVGAQDDGTFGAVTYYGPPPPVASVPVVEGGPGYATITWDGRYEDIEARAPNDFQAVEVWAAPEGTTPTALHRRVTFTDPAGGSVVVALDVGRWVVALVTRTTPGRRAAPSGVALVEVSTSASTEALELARQEMANAVSELETADAELAEKLAGVSAVIKGSAHPSEVPTDNLKLGDEYEQVASNGDVIGRWEWTAFGWKARALSGAAIGGVDVDKLRGASGSPLESAAVSQLWAQVVRARFLTATDKIITRDVIADGAVTARTMNVVSRDRVSGSMLSILPDGFRLYSRHDLDTGGNPIGLPTLSFTTSESMVFAVLDANDNKVAGIDAKGNSTAVTMAAERSIQYRGRELTDYLYRLPQGVLARGHMAGGAFTAAADVATGTCLLRWEVPSWYTGAHRPRTMLVTGGVTVNNNGGPAREIRIQVHKNASTDANTGNSYLSRQFFTVPAGAGYHELNFAIPFDSVAHFGLDVVPGRTLSLLASVTPMGSSADIMVHAGNTWLMLEDKGPQVPSVGTGPPTSPSTGSAPPTEHTVDFKATGFAIYRNSGSATTSGNAPVQGYTPYAPSMGVKGTHIFFNDAAIRAALNGATVASVELYLYAEHWHAGTGGVATLWTHPYSSSPGTIGSMSAVQNGSHEFARGHGRWLPMPTDGWGSGTRRGVGLYPPNGTTSTLHYGVMSWGAEQRPVLRFRYYK